MKSTRIQWRRREVPLTPEAAVGVGPSAVSLAKRILQRNITTLQGVAGDNLLLVVGPPDTIPWVDGLVWLGRDPLAPALLLPTTQTPTVHPALLANYAQEPSALVPTLGLQISLKNLRALWPEALQNHVATWRNQP